MPPYADLIYADYLSVYLSLMLIATPLRYASARHDESASEAGPNGE